MSLWLSLRPWWLQWPLYALVVVLGLTPLVMIGDYPTGPAPSHWTSAPWWITVAVVALVIGLATALGSSRRMTGLRPSLEALSFADCRQVSKAMRSGPVPDDPARRQAARQLIKRARDSIAGSAKLMIAACWILVAVQVVGFISDAQHFTLRSLVLTVAFAYLGGYYWYYPRLLDARLQLLDRPAAG
ncbi:hypothetical protein MSAS_38230 [Mycobacterium saskatchewanense]|uniref:Uncharacterized protein n=1 Tax=Mycobacterium saskatchewanense TaxID=220927 RepID=A0AAJ3NTB5_9MYCO|nr:hypothetical protein [Mycobacterium saskatchewanense]ORW73394.1 hypothetical protein AWC23_07390 [Mycobacterium saskatchewanense]BBX64649.1 hypothetical protein MSAS_38230 [Mycobacterium saskatchewanense]